jgi:hypothetical protein
MALLGRWDKMALLKSVKTNFGIDATYWNISSIVEDFRTKNVVAVIVGYVSKEARNNNDYPITSDNLTFAGDDYIKDATREAVYLALKTKDFSDAKDC